MLLTDLIQLYDPNAEFAMSNEKDIETLQWIKSNKPKPTLKDLENCIPEFEQRQEKKRIAKKRRSAYGPIEEQLDIIVKEGIEEYRKKMIKVKNDNPYPDITKKYKVSEEKKEEPKKTLMQKLKDLFKKDSTDGS